MAADAERARLLAEEKRLLTLPDSEETSQAIIQVFNRLEEI